MSKEVIELVGRVEESFPNATFRVRVMLPNGKEHELLCHLAGRMRLHRVRILPGDRVKIEMTPYDLEKGRIVFRLPSQQEEERMRRMNEGTAPTASPPPPPQ
ncbi:MAG: translation initiation factor IF-1 [Patescibacteria group bacterium]|mgnify:CR=1 FL=1